MVRKAIMTSGKVDPGTVDTRHRTRRTVKPYDDDLRVRLDPTAKRVPLSPRGKYERMLKMSIY